MRLPYFTMNCMVCSAGLGICVELLDNIVVISGFLSTRKVSLFEGACFSKVNFFSRDRALTGKASSC